MAQVVTSASIREKPHIFGLDYIEHNINSFKSCSGYLSSGAFIFLFDLVKALTLVLYLLSMWNTGSTWRMIAKTVGLNLRPSSCGNGGSLFGSN